jgi:hypothetical protein
MLRESQCVHQRAALPLHRIWTGKSENGGTTMKGKNSYIMSNLDKLISNANFEGISLKGLFHCSGLMLFFDSLSIHSILELLS